jgi:hypothetical protein
MMAIKRGLAAAIIVCVFALSLSVEVFAEQDSGTFLVVTMKDGSSEVFSVPVDSDKVESAAFAFPDAGLHELEGKHNLVAIINDVPITTGDFMGLPKNLPRPNCSRALRNSGWNTMGMATIVIVVTCRSNQRTASSLRYCEIALVAKSMANPFISDTA